MKQLAAVVVACLITIPSVTFGPSGRMIRVSAANVKNTSLSSLSITSTHNLVKQALQTPSPKPLGASDFFDYSSGCSFGSITIANQDYPTALKLLQDCDKASLNAHLYPGYNAITFGLIASDDTNSLGGVDVFADGQLYRSFPVAPHADVHQVVVPFGGHRILIFVRHGQQWTTYALINPTVIFIASAATPSRSSKAFQIIPRYPTSGAGVPAESKVPFAWQPFPGAANYAFHIWMVNQSRSATITTSTPFSFSASIHNKTTYLWNDHGFLPGTYQYALLPLDATGKALAGWSTPTQITVAS